VLKSTIPFVKRVENRHPASGGAAPEAVEEAVERGPLTLRTRNRAVTADDYEHFALAASDGVARVRCVPPAPDDTGGPARVVLVPRMAAPGLVPPAADRLVVGEEDKRKVREAIEARRVLGARFVVQDARYQAVRVDALVRVLPGFDEHEAIAYSTQALHRLFHPTYGGVDGRGWVFGRAAYSGMAYVALQRLAGIDIVQELKLYPVDIETGQLGRDQQRIELEPDAVVVSGDHRVAALPSEESV
jgi:predicted phage baseplate assembly protein